MNTALSNDPADRVTLSHGGTTIEVTAEVWEQLLERHPDEIVLRLINDKMPLRVGKQ